MTLDGKVALVTGAGSGIGRATLARLAQAGARVVGGDVRHRAAIAAAAEVRDGHAVELDVLDPTSIQGAVAAALERFGRLDVVVNSAGVLGFGAAHELDEDDWDRCVDVNLKGVYLVSKAVWPHLLANRGGVIVNLGSIFGLHSVPADVAYCVSKAGVIMLTKCLALDGAPDGIRVNCVSPGYVATPMTEHSFAVADDPDGARREAIRQHPLGRLGKPEDIANAIAYLASDEAGWITGANLLVDGGYMTGPDARA